MATLIAAWLLGLPLKVTNTAVGPHAGDPRGNLVAINLEALRECRRNFELQRDVVLGFVAPECDERWFATPLRPVQMRVERQGRQVLHAHRDVE